MGPILGAGKSNLSFGQNNTRTAHCGLGLATEIISCTFRPELNLRRKSCFHYLYRATKTQILIMPRPLKYNSGETGLMNFVPRCPPNTFEVESS